MAVESHLGLFVLFSFIRTGAFYKSACGPVDNLRDTQLWLNAWDHGVALGRLQVAGV